MRTSSPLATPVEDLINRAQHNGDSTIRNYKRVIGVHIEYHDHMHEVPQVLDMLSIEFVTIPRNWFHYQLG